MGYRIVTGPAAEPVTRAEAKLWLRVEDYGSPAAHPDDALIDALIEAARQYVERYINAAIVDQTVEVAYDSFAPEMLLPFGGATSITSVKYQDADDVEQTASSALYIFDSHSSPKRVVLAYGQSWPDALAERNAVKVTYQAGDNSSPQDVDERIKTAIKLLVADYYENREAKIVGVSVAVNQAVGALLYPLRELGL